MSRYDESPPRSPSSETLALTLSLTHFVLRRGVWRRNGWLSSSDRGRTRGDVVNAPAAKDPIWVAIHGTRLRIKGSRWRSGFLKGSRWRSSFLRYLYLLY
ncbi:hypothetical protein AAHE18_08G208200 [Arachis hypogaea]